MTSKRDRSRDPDAEARRGAPAESPEADPEAPPAGSEAAAPEAGAEELPAADDAAPDFRDRWLRAEAELQNFRRRASREWEEGRRIAEENVFLELVSALDDLERAIAAASESGADSAWLQGVSLVAQRLRDYLQRQGVRVVDALGAPFDPNFHDALLEVDPPEGAAPGTIVQVVHKGYARGERALRPARVVVARLPGTDGE